jgi:hypothetical protein
MAFGLLDALELNAPTRARGTFSPASWLPFVQREESQ